MEEEQNNEQAKPPQELSADSPTLPRPYGDLVGSDSAPKTTWPELVGLTAEEGEKKIKEEKPGAQIQLVKTDCFVTMDFRQSRVRLFMDSQGKIARAPRIG